MKATVCAARPLMHRRRRGGPCGEVRLRAFGRCRISRGRLLYFAVQLILAFAEVRMRDDTVGRTHQHALRFVMGAYASVHRAGSMT